MILRKKEIKVCVSKDKYSSILHLDLISFNKVVILPDLFNYLSVIPNMLTRDK